MDTPKAKKDSLIVREIDHPERGHMYTVLYSSSGEYAGNVCDGSDCMFTTMDAAEAYIVERLGDE